MEPSEFKDISPNNNNQYSEKREKLKAPMIALSSTASLLASHLFNRMRLGIQWLNVNIIAKGVPLKEAIYNTPELRTMELGKKIPHWYPHFFKVSLPAEGLPLIFQVLGFNYLYNTLHLTGTNLSLTMLIGFAAGALGTLIALPFSKLHHMLLMCSDTPSFSELLKRTFSIDKLTKTTVMENTSRFYRFAPWFLLRGGIEGATFLPIFFYIFDNHDFPLYSKFFHNELNIRLWNSKYVSRCHYERCTVVGTMLCGLASSLAVTLYDSRFYYKTAKDSLFKENRQVNWYEEMLNLVKKRKYWQFVFMSWSWTLNKYLMTYGITLLAYNHKGLKGINRLGIYIEDQNN